MISGLATWLLAVFLGPGDDTWALRAIGAPSAPRVADEAWPLDDIDRFLLSEIEAAGLTPSPAADPETLLRRVHFDLVGLPPSPEALASFREDPSTYEAVVDSLLASREFAERWGRHWLDVARFAESSGGGRSLMFPDAWRYRDYVIDAVHEDVPYDRFIFEQLAGDLLPAESAEERNRLNIATGFLLLGPTNYEQQDKELLRLDVIDEQIDTVGRAFLGSTLGCARCHDHMFDPVTTEDYYGLAGVFGSTEALTPGNVSGWTTAEIEGPVLERWRAHQESVRELEAELSALSGQGQAPGNIVREGLPGLLFDDDDAELIGEWKLSTFTSGYLDRGYLHDENRAKGEKSATWAPVVPAEGAYSVRLSWTPGGNRASNVPVQIDHADGSAQVTVDQRKPPILRGWFADLGTYRFDPEQPSVITVRTGGTDGHVILDALWLVPASEVTEEEAAATADAEALADLQARLDELRGSAPPRPGIAMVAREASVPGDEPIRVRGSAHELGETVPRRPPGFVGLDSGPVPEGASGRLELAAWIVDPANPLTARVRVNRVWGRLFGQGIVRTPEDFGARGDRPSHPALLDRLAHDHVEAGWSLKGLVRRLVLTQAYRMASALPPEQDPENRLLAVYPLRRLDADALRDAMLSVSGEMDGERGGPTIAKLTQYDYGYDHVSMRRSVYVPRFRNSVLDLFEVFDGPNENVVTGSRGESQVPTQALFLMNSPWVRARARAAAERVLAAEGDPLDHAYALTLGRAPSPAERELLVATDLDGWTRNLHALMASIDFRYVR